MKMTPETLLPYGDGDKKHNQVEKMFNAIASTYDFMNRLMSFRQDVRWRKTALRQFEANVPEKILDVATGTGDFAIEAFRKFHPSEIVGIDLSEGMMKVAEDKVRKEGIAEFFRFEKQDCMSLTFPDNTFNAVTVAFGVRNFENIAKGISEMFRVLKPGGKLVILELSRPEWFPAKQLFDFYSSVLIPAAGKLFTRDTKAYVYLPESIQLVPQGNSMTAIMKSSGFEKTGYKTFTFGVCSMYFGTKPVSFSD